MSFIPSRLRQTKHINQPLLMAATMLAIILFSVIQSTTTSAAPVVGFNPGRIIDDAVFTNKTSMNPAQIQGFLNNKVPVCDTWGTQPSEFGGGTRAQWGTSRGTPPPYVCLRDYTENGKSAAQIIYDTAQEFQINPQVLIVLLQKEQGLITDTWPLPVQYRTATGYGCPDTAACDSQYFGLTNQLRWSGRMFRAILNNSPTWYTPYVLGNNFIQWSPNSACGGSNVNIQNRSTQALYNYTPYQPNQSALNAGYGMGDSCGAYGNRNFYLYFTDWFGSVNYTFGNKPSHTSSYARASSQGPVFDSSYVGRLYNPDSRDFLYTTNQAEAKLAISYGYIWDGVVFKNASGADSIPVYRLSNSERHLYTSSSSVKDEYISTYGYKDEGIGFYGYSTQGAARTPVYAVQRADTFFLTSAAKEAEYYDSNYGYWSFGTVFYTEALSSTQIPVYRLSKSNSRLYTASEIEKNYATSLGFNNEGGVALADADPNSANLPVYRLRSPTGVYFYTIDRIERDSAVINHGYMSEGIGFYTLLYSNSPIYRSTNYSTGLRLYTNSAPEYTNSFRSYGFTTEGVGWYSY